MIWSQNLRLSPREVRSLCTVLLSGFVGLLLVYALLWEAGNIDISGCKKIGFYNYCLHNEAAAGCYCYTNLEDLRQADIAFPQGLVVAHILVYFSLVIFLFGTLALGLSLCFSESVLWLFALCCNVLSFALLCLGLTTFLSLTWALLELSELTAGFVALLVAIKGLALLAYIMTHNAGMREGISKPKGEDLDGDQIYILVN
ncbi:hypothetical protein FKM82_011665 [Ascaphus truei]